MTEQGQHQIDFVELMAAVVDSNEVIILKEESLAKTYKNKALRIEPGPEGSGTYEITLVDESVVEGELVGSDDES